jgi:hypothetical protein
MIFLQRSSATKSLAAIDGRQRTNSKAICTNPECKAVGAGRLGLADARSSSLDTSQAGGILCTHPNTLSNIPGFSHNKNVRFF